MTDQTNKIVPPKKKFQVKYKHQKLIWSGIFLLPWVVGFTTLFTYVFGVNNSEFNSAGPYLLILLFLII